MSIRDAWPSGMLLVCLAAGCARPTRLADEPWLPGHAEWELTFAEEFEGEGVDWATWESQAGPRGRDRLEGRWPENNVVRDGLRHRGRGWPVYVDNLVVRVLED